MTFAHPLFLLGTLAAFIPLLIHLFDRRRPRQVPFGALSFVLRSQKRTASRLKLKRLLLYTLRTLLFLAVPIALARPEWTASAAVQAQRGVAATAIVVDASLALRWSAGTSLLDRAKREVKAAVADLLAEEPVALVVCHQRNEIVSPLSFDRASVVSAVNALKPSYVKADLNGCFDVALNALQDSPLKNRRIVLVSALTNGTVRFDVPPPSATTAQGVTVKPEIILRDVANGVGELNNRAILDVRGEPAPQLGPRTWQFTFTVHNFSETAVSDVELQLKVDDVVVSKGFVDLPASGGVQKTLTHKFSRGGVMTVEGALAPDALPDDDVRGLVVEVPKDLKVLLANGAPNPQKYRDEAFFTEAALSAAGSPVRAVVRDADAAWKEDFATYDALYLLNVAAPAPEIAKRLETFVMNGGAMFISVGDRVDIDAWNQGMRGVLPRQLRVIKTAVEPTAADAASRAAKLQSVSSTHVVMAPFLGKAREGLLSTRFYKYALFEAGAAADSEVLATLDDGAAALVVGKIGKGRVAAFASSVDPEWSDFPIRSSFLPLMQRLAGWLCGSLETKEPVVVRVGSTREISGAQAADVVHAFDPSGGEVAVHASPGSSEVAVGPVAMPGVHTISNAANQVIESLSFSAVIDPAASDTTRLDEAEMSSWLGAEVVHTSVDAGQRRATPMWSWLLFAAVAFLFGEGLLLRR